MRETVKQLLHTTPWYAYLLVVLSILAGLVIAVFIYSSGDQVQENTAQIDHAQQALDRAQVALDRSEQALVALCYQRDDLDARLPLDLQRLRDQKAFLRSHPRGLPGIGVDVLKAQILVNERAYKITTQFRRNLEVLDCE